MALHLCGRKGHFLACCPEVPKAQTPQPNKQTLMNQTSLTFQPKDRVELRDVLRWAQDSIPSIFVNQNFLTQTDIPTEPLAEPKEVLAIDSNFLVKVTHVTMPVALTLSGNHYEKLQLFAVSSPPSRMVLVLPWQHNPNIDWPIWN